MARKLHEKICSHCGIEFSTINSRQLNCSRKCGNLSGNEKLKKYYKCSFCGNQFSKDSAYRMKYCSTACSNEARRIPEKVKKERILQKQINKQCQWCSKDFTTTYPNKIYCSDECGYAGNLRDKRLEWADEFDPKFFNCKECNVEVITECGKPFSTFCSIGCQEKYIKRNYKLRRKEQMQNAYREPVSYKKIFKRDNGVCGICGLAVLNDKTPTNLWGATIDHIIPLSQGGTHEPSNCQLAHRLCNSIKVDVTEEFIIDWEAKNIVDERRWTSYLKDYKKQIISNSI